MDSPVARPGSRDPGAKPVLDPRHLETLLDRAILTPSARRSGTDAGAIVDPSVMPDLPAPTRTHRP
ncbi:hypothetical protein GCM10010464_08140 [Pseudonocardia yunnanensis]|uniref:Uncharacterized protein n=1 Tax=Pseudonocardia yunnanensis TaxID=58107 RepID=A0ABW4ETA4_9PSEU